MLIVNTNGSAYDKTSVTEKFHVEPIFRFEDQNGVKVVMLGAKRIRHYYGISQYIN